MKTLVEHLTAYASYHRDKRNIATHFVGIPMIVVGTQSLLARLEDMLPSLDAMTALPEPSSVISAGDSRGIFDVSLGFSY